MQTAWHMQDAISQTRSRQSEKATRKQSSHLLRKALVRISAVYDLEGGLKDLSPEERLKEKQKSIKPLLEEFFTWIHEIKSDQTVLPKGETAKGINYCLNQEKYLKVFLSDGEVPIDNLASERALRTFTIGRKNWMTLNTVRGAQASAMICSITETARANGLNVYYYVKHLSSIIDNFRILSTR